MRSTIKFLFKTLMQGLTTGIVIACILILVEILFGRKIDLNPAFLREFGRYCLYAVTLSLINATFFDYVNRRVMWKKYARYRILIGVVGSVVLTMIGVFFVRMFISMVLEGEDFATFLGNENLQSYRIFLLITLIVSLFFHMLYFYKKTQENKVKEQKIIAGTASAKFESLKNQIDPHFLFNSLNVLSSLIEENPENAQKFTTSLSKVYRYVLEQKDKELVSVEEELSFAKTYMNLLKMRFENSLFYELPENVLNPEAKVVPLSLQLLLENTVKHNVASEQKPLHIRIFVDGDYLAIENVFQKKEVLNDRQGVGLQNIVSRYAIITNRKVLVDQNERSFTVKIPILTKQVSVMETTYNNEQSAYLKATKKMEDIKGFYGNLISYVIVITGLAVLNLATYPEYLWFFYPAIGWGIGVAVHGMAVFNIMPFLGKDWEERKIRELVEKEKSKKWN
jgi:sensor histidine kinase YesM